MNNTRPLWRVVLVLALSMVSYASLAPWPGDAVLLGVDKLTHCVTYAFLYVLAWLAFTGPVFRWCIHVALFGFGVGLELLQAQTGYRLMEVADVLANITGTGFGNLMLSFFYTRASEQLNALSTTAESVK